MEQTPFQQNVFINCPFDEDFAPILQAMLFCVVYLGYYPRFASERNDAGENRLQKIQELIKCSRFSIHDLSRCQASKKGEYFRLNMPFELGMDYGCRQYFGDDRRDKKFLILEEKKYRYQETISDLSGSDIESHAGDYQKAIRKVRNWLVSEANSQITDGASKILGAYYDFQEWHHERQLVRGFSEDDIRDYPTNELLDAMKTWIAAGKPI